jgi:hypothetical protein
MWRSDIGEIIKKIKDAPHLMAKCLVIGTIAQDSIPFHLGMTNCLNQNKSPLITS